LKRRHRDRPRGVPVAALSAPPLPAPISTGTACTCCTSAVRRLLSASFYVSFEIMLKIGMYIAMTMPPTITPRMAIMIGSISVRRPATAVSTSSS